MSNVKVLLIYMHSKKQAGKPRKRANAHLNMNFYFLIQKFKPLPSSSISSCFDSFLPLLELKQVLGKDINLKLYSKNYHTFEVTIFLPIP
jgi:hypothetical protein